MDNQSPFLIPALELAIQILQERLDTARGQKPQAKVGRPLIQPAQSAAPVPSRPTMSHAARAKIAAAQKKRWAAMRKAQAAPTTPPVPPVKTSHKKKAPKPVAAPTAKEAPVEIGGV